MTDNLQNEIKELIKKKREGCFWDFKQKHYANNAELLHDILCMANSLHPGNKYLIIGIENSSFNVVGVSDEDDRKSQANLMDFLSKRPFAGDIRPEVELHALDIEKKQVDVIVVLDKPEKPYFLSEDYTQKEPKKITINAGAIYSRVGDKNTAKNRTADLYHVEKMWKQRFGLDLSVMERFKQLLKEPQNWCHNPANPYIISGSQMVSHDHFPVYHEIFPEFRIELSETEETEGESFCYFYPNPKSFLGKAYFKYHSTTIFELEYMFCDGRSVLLPVPDTEILRFNKIFESWFYYYTLDGIVGLFLTFLGNGNIQIDTRRGGYPPILIFDNSEELDSFVTYAKKKEEYIEKIKPRNLPHPTRYNAKYFRDGDYKKYSGRIEGNAVFISRMGEIYKDWKVYNSKGCFADNLTLEEVIFSKQAADYLKKCSWTDKIFKDPKILRSLKINPKPDRKYSDLNEIKSALFEVRFAYNLYKIGLTAEYEYCCSVGNSSIDFKFEKDNHTWLVELTSCRESNEVKKNTCVSGKGFAYLSIDNQSGNSPEMVDIIKTQSAILNKVCKGIEEPIKFSRPKDAYFHMVLIDMRAFNVGISDYDDYKNIVFGSEASDGIYRREWVNQNGEKSLIKGLFDDNHPDNRSIHIRERIHILGFIMEEKYAENELLEKIRYFYNPRFFCNIPQKELPTLKFTLTNCA